jgi:Thiamine pyrophosphate enzyme, C-terminal TPP binding domain
MGLAFAHLPREATFHNQTLWGSIGWATPAAFGAAVACPNRRVILVTGEGSHQLTAQEISQFGRRGLTPIIFVLNNNGYLIVRLLCADPDIAYNDVAQRNYAQLPQALGCTDWFTARAATCGELDAAMTKLRYLARCPQMHCVHDRHDSHAASERDRRGEPWEARGATPEGRPRKREPPTARSRYCDFGQTHRTQNCSILSGMTYAPTLSKDCDAGYKTSVAPVRDAMDDADFDGAKGGGRC